MRILAIYPDKSFIRCEPTRLIVSKHRSNIVLHKNQIEEMLIEAGLKEIRISEGTPFLRAVLRKCFKALSRIRGSANGLKIDK